MPKSLFIGLVVIALLAAVNACKVEFIQPKCNLRPPTAGNPPTITDFDGNVYHTIKIGNQTWMQENLKTTHYRNGLPIAQIDSASYVNIPNDSTVPGCWSYYNYNATNNLTYGKCYNWYAVTDSNQLCPLGWHSPSDPEWTEMLNYLSGGCDSFLFYPSGFNILPSPVVVSYPSVYAYWSSSPDTMVNLGSTDSANGGILYQLNYNSIYSPYYRLPSFRILSCFVRCVAN